MVKAKVAVCTLAQWALDFEGNRMRILESLRLAKKADCKYRLGPELEISGYGEKRHYQAKKSVVDQSWKSVAAILDTIQNDYSSMLIDIGLPVLYKGKLYNCRLYILDRKLLALRPKVYLAEGEEEFTRWPLEKKAHLESFALPPCIIERTNQTHIPIGICILEDKNHITLASEICEELFVPHSLNEMLVMQNVDIIANGSASFYKEGKHEYRKRLMQTGTETQGSCYLYANQYGFDGGNHFYDGGSMIWVNGQLLKEGDRFTFRDVEVLTESLSITNIRKARKTKKSMHIQAKNYDYAFPHLLLHKFSF